MRIKRKFVTIVISEETHKKLVLDKHHFEKIIGGGKWSFDDVINELYKIIRTYEK